MLLNTTLFNLQQFFARSPLKNSEAQCPGKIPSFNIFDANKKQKDSIIATHMEYRHLNVENALRGETFITCRPSTRANAVNATGKTFIRIYDNVALPDDPTEEEIPCVFLFQQHKYGNYVVIRNNLRPLMEAAQNTDDDRIELYGHIYSRRHGGLWIPEKDEQQLEA